MKNFQELLERIENQRHRLGISKHPAWYRGHRFSKYKLLPTLLRHKNGPKHERNLFAIFKNEGAALLPNSNNSLEILAMMQHYGAPTRLLDWTESVHAALFFAVMHDLTWAVNDPCIWILNPFRLSAKATGKNVVYDQDDALDINYYDCARNMSWPFDLPVAIAAPWRSPRVNAQRGFFTMHGNDTRPIEESASECVKKIPIPPHLVRDVISNLSRSSTSHSALFPDLDGLSKKLRRQFKLF